MSEKVIVPWSAEEVEALNLWQTRGDFHPYTCGRDECSADLIATPSGWICPNDEYRQNWAHLGSVLYYRNEASQ